MSERGLAPRPIDLQDACRVTGLVVIDSHRTDSSVLELASCIARQHANVCAQGRAIHEKGPPIENGGIGITLVEI